MIYYYSYLEAFGLEPALFHIDKEATFFKGYLVALQMGASLLTHLIIFVALAFGAAIIVDDLVKQGRWNEKPIFSSLTAKGIAATCIAAATVAGSIYLLALSMLTAYKIGTDQAVKDAEQFRTHAEAANPSHVIASINKNPGQVKLDGFKIICSDKWCAFYVDSKIEVHPLENIISLQSNSPMKDHES